MPSTISSSATVSGGSDIMASIMANKWYILIGLIFIGLFVTLYFTVFKKYTKFNPNMEHQSDDGSSNKSAEILIFKTDWCPHCTAAKPAWDDIVRQYDGKTVNGYRLQFTEVNCTEESPEIEAKMNEYGVEGFPTIKMVKDGQIIEFDAKPTKDNLEQYINTVL
jgi:thiol-disulfide isomerase/thioredoxin